MGTTRKSTTPASTAAKDARAAAKAEADAAAKAAVAELPEPMRTMPYRELATKAKAEGDAVKAARKAKKAKPDSPHLDALNVRHAAGETYAGAPSTTRKDGKPRTAKPEPVPAPEVRGFTAVGLRSDKHATLVAAAIAKVGDSKVDGLWLLVKNAEAKNVAKALADAASANAKVIYDARLYSATYTEVRRCFPKLDGMRKGAGDKAITALNASGLVWSVAMKVDGTLNFKVTLADGTDVEGGARQVLDAIPEQEATAA